MTRSRSNELVRIALAVCLALAATAALADERTVDERKAADAKGTVSVENLVGSIRIEGWDREEVHVTGTLGEDVKDLEFKASGRKTRIEVKYPRNMRNIDEGADLVIMVPKGSRLDVECVSAGISVSGVRGEIFAASISGDVEVDGGQESVTAETISGDVEVIADAPQISVESISGTVRARGGEAEVAASVVSGRIDLEFDLFTDLEVEAVSGTVDISGDLDRGAKADIDVHSGDITLTVPGSVSADFRVDTFSGNIDNAFGHKARKTSKYTPGKELEFSVGDGEARVRINTFSGNVIIRRK